MRLNRNWWVGALVLFVGAATFQNQASAQAGTANVHGTVTDSTGAVLPNANVIIVNDSTGVALKATTDSKGYYVFPQLKPGGPYTVTVTDGGFQAYKTSGLNLSVNASREMDAALKIGSAGQTIQVQASQVAVETSDTQLKTTLSAHTIESMPLMARDVTILQKLAPGVVESSDRFGTFSSDGNQTPQNAYIFDGVDINDGPIQSQGFTPDPDSLSEFQVVLSTLNPEYARNSGAVDLETSKSGSNAYHGEGFEFYRQNFMNAVPFTLQPDAHFTPNYHRNLFGGNLGGPILKNKLFFFASYQGTRQKTSGNKNANTLSSSVLAGNFSQTDLTEGSTGNSTTFSENPMPFTVGSCQAGTAWDACPEFSGSSAYVSPSDFNPLSVTLVNKYFPKANGTINGVPSYFFNTADTLSSDQGITRLDYHISPSDSIWSSVSFESSPVTTTLPFDGATVPGFGEIDTQHTKVISVTETHIFSPTLVNQLRGGYYRFNYKAVSPQNVVNPSSLGFSITPQDASAASVPYISILNGPAIGFSYNGPQPRVDSNMEFSDDLSKVVGTHNFKFGARFEQFRTSNPFYGNNSGNYQFQAGGSFSSGNPLLDFMLGIPDSYAQGSGGLIDVRAKELYAYAQDNWKALNNLVLNYGLAWDVETPNQNMQYGGEGVVCYSLSNVTSKVFPGGPPGLLYPGDKGCNRAAGPDTKYNHFSPRVGFAWSPTNGPKFVVGSRESHQFSLRGGFGVYYNRDQEEGQLQNLNQPPYGLTSTGAGELTNGSPSFANPFADIATARTVANPFPYSAPKPGATIDWNNLTNISINGFSKGYTTPIVYSFNLNVQRQLPGAMILTVGYVGTIGHHLINVIDGDPITPAGHAACLANPACISNRLTQHVNYPQNTAMATVANPIAPNGNVWYNGVGLQSSNGNSNYNSLQIQLQKAETHGLSFDLAYTYSHALDDASGLESSGFNGRGYNSYPGFQYLNYGNSDFDARQRISYSLTYQVPTFLFMQRNIIMREGLAGWTISGYGALQTGNPITVYENGDYRSLWCDSDNYYDCPDSPNTSDFNEKTYSNPRKHNMMGFDATPFSAEQIGTFGNTKRNYFAGPHFNYTDASLFKNFYIGSGTGRYLQLRMSAQNVFNHTNFAAPDGNFHDGVASFGVISSVYQPNSADGDPAPARVVQIGSKIVF